MVNYDADILREYASRLYSRAVFIQVAYTFFGGVIGLVGGIAAQSSMRVADNVVFGLAAIAALIGFAWSRERAFMLRLEAQQTLCHVQIEENTRARSAAAGASK